MIEGFTANGELMATLPALAALALTARWQVRGGLRIMFAAGLLAGAGVLVKQSGYDGGLAAGLWLALAAWRGWRPAGEALRALARARARRRGDRRRGRAARGADRLPRLVVRGRRLPPLGRERGHRVDLGALVAVHRLAAHRRPRDGCAHRARTAGHLAGPAPPRDRPPRDLARALADRLRARRALPRALLRRAADAAVRARGADAGGRCPRASGLALGLLTLVLPAYKAWPSYTADGTRERSLASSSDSRIVHDGAVGRYLHAHTQPGDTIYAMYADASLYLASGRRSPYPYLWFLGIEHIPGALQRLRDTLAGPRAPRYIAVYQQPREIDKSHRPDSIKATLHRRYRPAERAPSAISERIVSRDSVRGSSAVSTVRSASSDETLAIISRLARSLRPADPKTAMRRPEGDMRLSMVRAACRATPSAFGVCAKSTMAVKSWPSSISSILPGTCSRLATPRATAAGETPAPITVAVMAARQFETLYTPGRRLLMSIRMSPQAKENSVPAAVSFTFAATAVRVRAHAVGDGPDMANVRQKTKGTVVPVQHGQPGIPPGLDSSARQAREQPGLGRPVVLIRPMLVQMFVCDVGHDSDIELTRVHTMLRPSVRRCLEYAMRQSRIHHAAQVSLHLVRIGCGDVESCVQLIVSNHGVHRGYEPRRGCRLPSECCG